MSVAPSGPPPFARWLLERATVSSKRREVLADFDDMFGGFVTRVGLRAARRRYMREVLLYFFWRWKAFRPPTASLSASSGRAYSSSSMSQSVGEIMGHLVDDIRYATRALFRRPGYAIAVLLTMTLAIGATTAVFTVVNGVLLRPLPHPDPNELVLIFEVDQRPGTYDDHNPVSTATYLDWRDQNQTFSGMSNFAVGQSSLRADGTPFRVNSGWVGADFFNVLGVGVVIGRPIVPDDLASPDNHVIVISHTFWLRQFGGDSSVIGRTVEVAGRTASIVGVAEPGFRFLDREVDVWRPLFLSDAAIQNRRSHRWRVVARLHPDVPIEEAQLDMERITANLQDAYPDFMAGWGVNVTSLANEVVGSIRPALLVLFGAVGFVLLIAVVNIANLMLTRTIADSQELSVRTALGAGRGRLIRYKLAESLVIGVVGGTLGVSCAVLATRLLLAAAPEQLPRVTGVAVNGVVMTFALLVTVLASLLIGVAPARHATRVDLASGLREVGRHATGSRGQRRLRGAFAISQLAFSLVLLVSAGLMINTFSHLMRVDPGFDADGIASVRFSLPFGTYGGIPDQTQFVDRLLPEISALPGIQSFGVTNLLPLLDVESTWSVQIVGKPDRAPGEKRDYGWHAISAGYLNAIGTRLLRGRQFTEFDRENAGNVVLVNEAFVERFFDPGEDPIGRQMFVITADSVRREIVGIVENVRHYALETEPEPAYYMPYDQSPEGVFWLGQMNLVMRAAGEPEALLSSARRVIHDLDTDIIVSEEATMATRVRGSVARTRFATMLLNVFAGVALTLSLIGTYGVISYAVSQQSREIGLRLALGAQSRQVVRHFLTTGSRLVLAGILVGLVGAFVFTRFQASLLYDVRPFDPGTYAVVTAVLGCVALLAAYVPARRASRVDPMITLRGE